MPRVQKTAFATKKIPELCRTRYSGFPYARWPRATALSSAELQQIKPIAFKIKSNLLLF